MFVVQGKLQLRIGNHMLNCQLVALKKPLLVLQRARHRHAQQQQNAQNTGGNDTRMSDSDSDSDDERHNGKAEGAGREEEERVGLYCVAVIRQKVLVSTRPAPIVVGRTGAAPVLT